MVRSSVAPTTIARDEYTCTAALGWALLCRAVLVSVLVLVAGLLMHTNGSVTSAQAPITANARPRPELGVTIVAVLWLVWSALVSNALYQWANYLIIQQQRAPLAGSSHVGAGRVLPAATERAPRPRQSAVATAATDASLVSWCLNRVCGDRWALWLSSRSGQAAAVSASLCCLEFSWPCLVPPDERCGLLAACCPVLSCCSRPCTLPSRARTSPAASFTSRTAWGQTRSASTSLSSDALSPAYASSSASSQFQHGMPFYSSPRDECTVLPVNRYSASMAEGVKNSTSDPASVHTTRTKGATRLPDNSSADSSSLGDRVGAASSVSGVQTEPGVEYGPDEASGKPATPPRGAAVSDGVAATFHRKLHVLLTQGSKCVTAPSAAPAHVLSQNRSSRSSSSSQGGGVLRRIPTDTQEAGNGTQVRAGSSPGVERAPRDVLLAASIAGLQFMSSTAIPIVSLAVMTSIAVSLDLFTGPGRGSSKLLGIWILWPILAPLDYDKAAVPWAGMQFAYIAWSLGLFLTISFTGDAWPLGRADLDFLPEEHRYSFSSPLGLNGLGVVVDLIGYSLCTMVLVPAILGLDHSLLVWRQAVARLQLRRAQKRAIRQQQVIIDSVVDQVPPFAQECMEAGVMAFEARPVVMAVTFVGGAALSADAQHRDAAASAEMLCSAMDAGRASVSPQSGFFDTPFDGMSSQPAEAGPQPFFGRIVQLYRTAAHTSAEESVAAASIGVLTRTQRIAIAKMEEVQWARIAMNALQVDKIDVGIARGLSANAPMWMATAGLRTPVRSRTVLSPVSRRAADAVAFLAAVLRFAQASTRASSRGTQLRAGIAYPSSSQSAMVVGLLGLKQQPQEWSTFGGGRPMAKELASGCKCGRCGPSRVQQSHIATTAAAIRKVTDHLEMLCDGVQAALHWCLAILAAQGEFGGEQMTGRRGARDDSTLNRDLVQIQQLLLALRKVAEWLLSPSSRRVDKHDGLQRSKLSAILLLLPCHARDMKALRESLQLVLRAASLPADGPPHISPGGGSAFGHDAPIWLAQIMQPVAREDATVDTQESVASIGGLQTEQLARFPAWQAMLDEMHSVRAGGISAILLPQAKMRTLVNASHLQSSNSDLMDAAPFRSGAVLVLLGVALAFSALVAAVQAASMDVVARQSTDGAVLSFARSLPAMLPKFLAGLSLVCVGLIARCRQQRLEASVVGPALIAAVLGTSMSHALWYLEIGHESCLTWSANVMNVPGVIVAVLASQASFQWFGRSVASVVFALLATLAISPAPFQLLQTSLGSSVVRSFEDAADDCASVWNGAKHMSLDHSFGVLAGLFVPIMFVGYFMADQLQRSHGSAGQLSLLRSQLQQAAALADCARDNLLQAAAHFVPVQLIKKKIFLEHGQSQQLHGSRSPFDAAMVGRSPRSEPPMVRAKLGGAVVATVALGGFESIRDIVGPVASFGLHRKLGAVADKICSKFGGVRIRGHTGQLSIGWYASKVSSVAGRFRLGEDTGITAQALRGSAELAAAMLAALTHLQADVHVSIGVASGEISAAWVGCGPAQVLYLDVDAQDGPIATSAAIAEGMASLSQCSVDQPRMAGQATPTVALSRSLAESAAKKHPALASLLGWELQADGSGQLHAILRRPPRVFVWEPFLRERQAEEPGGQQQRTATFRRAPHYHLLHRVHCIWMRIDCVDHGMPVSFRVLGAEHERREDNQSDSFEVGELNALQQAWTDRMSHALERVATSQNLSETELQKSSEADDALVPWLAQWCTCVSSGLEASLDDAADAGTQDGVGLIRVTRSFFYGSSAVLTAAPCKPGRLALLIQANTSLTAAANLAAESSYSSEAGKARPTQQLASQPKSDSMISSVYPPKQSEDGPPLPRRFQMHEFERLKLLGEGGFARVFLAAHRPTGRLYALKITDEARQGASSAPSRQSWATHSRPDDTQHSRAGKRVAVTDVVRSEILAMLRCAGHGVPGACRLEGVVIGDGEVGIVMELVDGKDLASLMRLGAGRQRMHEGATSSLAKQLFRTVEKMHNAGIIHRDIKPSNILIDGRSNARLVDFGLAAHSAALKPPMDASSKFCLSRAGSSIEQVGPVGPYGSTELPSAAGINAPLRIPALHWASEHLHDHDDLHLGLPLYSPPRAICVPGSPGLSAEWVGSSQSSIDGMSSVILVSVCNDSEITGHEQGVSRALGAWRAEIQQHLAEMGVASTWVASLRRAAKVIERDVDLLDCAIVVGDDTHPADLQQGIQDVRAAIIRAQQQQHDRLGRVSRSISAAFGSSQRQPSVGDYSDPIGRHSNSEAAGIGNKTVGMPIHCVRVPAAVGVQVNVDIWNSIDGAVHKARKSSRQRRAQAARAMRDAAKLGSHVHPSGSLLATEQACVAENCSVSAQGLRQARMHTQVQASAVRSGLASGTTASGSGQVMLKGTTPSFASESGTMARSHVDRAGLYASFKTSFVAGSNPSGNDPSDSMGHDHDYVAQTSEIHTDTVAGVATGDATDVSKDSVREMGSQSADGRLAFKVPRSPGGAPADDSFTVGLDAAGIALKPRSGHAAREGEIASHGPSQAGPVPEEAWCLDLWARAATESSMQRFKSRASAESLHPSAGGSSANITARDGLLFREQQPFAAGIAGTPLFMAPELFKHQGQRASDYWSLGVTLFWLLAGRMPFEGESLYMQLDNAKNGRVAWHLLPVDLSPACLDVLRGLLEVNTSRRYGAQQLMQHPWLDGTGRQGSSTADSASAASGAGNSVDSKSAMNQSPGEAEHELQAVQAGSREPCSLPGRRSSQRPWRAGAPGLASFQRNQIAQEISMRKNIIPCRSAGGMAMLTLGDDLRAPSVKVPRVAASNQSAKRSKRLGGPQRAAHRMAKSRREKMVALVRGILEVYVRRRDWLAAIAIETQASEDAADDNYGTAAGGGANRVEEEASERRGSSNTEIRSFTVIRQDCMNDLLAAGVSETVATRAIARYRRQEVRLAHAMPQTAGRTAGQPATRQGQQLHAGGGEASGAVAIRYSASVGVAGGVGARSPNPVPPITSVDPQSYGLAHSSLPSVVEVEEDDPAETPRELSLSGDMDDDVEFSWAGLLLESSGNAGDRT